ncbi:MAG TPA: hypothetical protein VFT02_12005 [Pyrinomonadaceae bacterium]|nr:hypothetical protein [Pyrinomonadaceae bacterium]
MSVTRDVEYIDARELRCSLGVRAGVRKPGRYRVSQIVEMEVVEIWPT